MKIGLISVLILWALSESAFAGQGGLVINAVEYGVAKFHRYDNKVHPYAAGNTWKNFVLPSSATTLDQIVTRNADGSYTVFFSAAEEMLQAAIQIATGERRPISILNIEAHGLPGGMWYPIDAAARASDACKDWVIAAQGQDKANYKQYYTPATKDEVFSFRQYAQSAQHSPQPCTSGLSEWETIVYRNPEIVKRMASGAEIHFISCIVGLGLTGQNFTTGMAQLFFGSGEGRVVTSVDFGLGDWSMPEGMGFWDYQSDQQIARDAIIYPRDRDDREVMQKGSVRVAGTANGHLGAQVFSGLDFFYVNELTTSGSLRPERVRDGYEPESPVAKAPLAGVARIPGTGHLVDLSK